MLEMGRPSYVCATCSEHFTRKYSARRHNQNLHNGAAEIVRLIDYLGGRSSGQYTPNNPFWYKHYNPYDNIGSSTVADSVGSSQRNYFTVALFVVALGERGLEGLGTPVVVGILLVICTTESLTCLYIVLRDKGLGEGLVVREDEVFEFICCSCCATTAVDVSINLLNGIVIIIIATTNTKAVANANRVLIGVS
jgi:hypothetical protein